jgi:CRP-like cAMP-binding protein
LRATPPGSSALKTAAPLVDPEGAVKSKDLERHFAPGERIVAHGSAARELYVIRSGEVRLGGPENERPLLLGPGDMFGEISAILGEPQPLDATADGEVTVLVLDTAQLNRLTTECPEFSARLIRHLAQRIASPDPAPGDAAPLASARSPELARLARVILARVVDDDGAHRVQGALRDLAAEAELTTLEAYRAIQQLIHQRVLRLGDDVLTLLDSRELEVLRD